MPQEMVMGNHALADVYDVNVATIRQWRKEGLPSTKQSGIVCYDLEKVEAWYQEHKAND